MKPLVLAIFLLGALALFVSCFCRATHTSTANTRRAIRWVFALMSALSVVCLAAPLYGYVPDGLTASLVAVLALSQVVTSHYWHQGVPPQFRKDQL